MLPTFMPFRPSSEGPYGINLIRDGAEPRKINGARVGRGTTENHGWAEEQRLFPQLLVFDDAHLAVHIVRERLEVEECGGDLLLGCVVTVGQVPTTWQAEAHDARVRCQQSRVHGDRKCLNKVEDLDDAQDALVSAVLLEDSV